MKQRILLVGVMLLLAACQVFGPAVSTPLPVAPSPQPAVDTPTPKLAPPTPTVKNTQPPAPTATSTPAGSGPVVVPTSSAKAQPASLEWDASKPFGGGMVQLTQWQPGAYPAGQDSLPVNLAQVGNQAVIAGLTGEQKDMLSQNGFTVLATGEKQFADIRESVGNIQGQPYYLTTDAAYHALHLTFDDLLKALEREQLRPQALLMTRALLERVQAFPAAGTPLEGDASLAAAYLAVGLRLLDPQADLPPDLAAKIQPQIDQVLAAGGRETSRLIPNFEDDYGAYKPVGHYAGDEDLENYFRGMTWFGRVSFKLRSLDDAAGPPSRAPLIVTLALRQPADDTGNPANDWVNLNELLNFLIGPADDPGPGEFAVLMDEIYGPGLDFAGLADETKWQAFLAGLDRLPAPQINSTFVTSTVELETARDWRLLGQRFTFDGSIFQNLIYDKVGTREKPRKLPTALDVMAVLGSPSAAQALEAAGNTGYLNYPEQLKKLQAAAQSQPEAQWLSRFYSGWLYSFIPQVAAKDTAYPPYMRSPAWNYKELNSALGSWAELKHDTVLYNKMPEFMGGGGPPSSGPPPAFVEPDPLVFYRLAYITRSLYEGLLFRSMTSYAVEPRGPGLERLINSLTGLGGQLQDFGDIAAKELAGQPLTEADRAAIMTCLGPVECLGEAYPETPPVPVIAAVSGAETSVLEVGVGLIDRIYIVVTIDGQPQIAQGGVFSYYELVQPREQRLTDEEWRQKLDSSPPPRPAWVEQFMKPGGTPAFSLAFRVNDVYIITEAGGTPPLNVRAEPSKSAAVLSKLERGTYITIIEGPVEQGGARWWKIRSEFEPAEGWVQENPEWLERAHGQ